MGKALNINTEKRILQKRNENQHTIFFIIAFHILEKKLTNEKKRNKYGLRVTTVRECCK